MLNEEQKKHSSSSGKSVKLNLRHQEKRVCQAARFQEINYTLLHLKTCLRQ